MSDIDSAKLLYALLLTSSSLVTETTNLVGSESIVDIYGPPGLPAAFEIRKAMFFLGLGGMGNVNLPIGSEAFDCYCYGKNAAEARLVFKTLRSFLHRKKHTRFVVDGETYQFEYGQIMSGPQDRTDPTEGWNLVYSSFLIQFIETTV